MDNEEVYTDVLNFVQRFQPALVSRVKMYTRSAPVFDAFNISTELEKALRPKVWLKSGGYIVINALDLLRNLFSYDALKRAIKNSEVKIEDVWEQYRLITTATMRPEPTTRDWASVALS